ncbi:MAG TPA: hypothetical protein VGO67_10205 [Verrucomicrobiae bacterium]|jgi:hypothetical protein
MLITRQTVASKLEAHLNHRLTLAELVDWAENSIMAGEFAENDTEVLRVVIPRLGTADVRAFGLSWEDCEQLLRQLGYSAQVNVVAA